MLLGSATPKRYLRSLRDFRHRTRIERIVGQFAVHFPVIHFDILWSSPTCNAQAFLLDGHKHVRLYGGLARHRGLSIAGIAWVMAHETGHHMGGPPLHPHYFWLSSEERADEWAAVCGLQSVFGRSLGRRYATVGRREAKRVAHLKARQGSEPWDFGSTTRRSSGSSPGWISSSATAGPTAASPRSATRRAG